MPFAPFASAARPLYDDARHTATCPPAYRLHVYVNVNFNFFTCPLARLPSRLLLPPPACACACGCSLWVALAWWQRWNLHWSAVSEFEACTGFTPSLLFAAGRGGDAPAHLVALSPAAAAAAVATLASERGEDASAAVAAANAQRAKDAKETASASASGKGSKAASSSSSAAAPSASSANTVPVPPRVAKAASALATDSRVLGVWQRLLWVVAVGMSCANAVSIKFTGLATPGMIAVESFFALWFLRRSVPMLDLLAIAAVVIVAFILYYYLHFGLLPNTGDGDAFMSVEFQRTLVNNTHYDPNAERPPFLKLTYDVSRKSRVARRRDDACVLASSPGAHNACRIHRLHRMNRGNTMHLSQPCSCLLCTCTSLYPTLYIAMQLNHEMVVASARIEQRHHWDSVWWEWIFNLRGILYYSRETGESQPLFQTPFRTPFQTQS